jgi:hypothetical protein
VHVNVNTVVAVVQCTLAETPDILQACSVPFLEGCKLVNTLKHIEPRGADVGSKIHAEVNTGGRLEACW